MSSTSHWPQKNCGLHKHKPYYNCKAKAWLHKNPKNRRPGARSDQDSFKSALTLVQDFCVPYQKTSTVPLPLTPTNCSSRLARPMKTRVTRMTLTSTYTTKVSKCVLSAVRWYAETGCVIQPPLPPQPQPAGADRKTQRTTVKES